MPVNKWLRRCDWIFSKIPDPIVRCAAHARAGRYDLGPGGPLYLCAAHLLIFHFEEQMEQRGRK